MNYVFESWMNDSNLVWLPHQGVGYLNSVRPEIYDRSYWDKYAEYDRSELGHKLNRARRDLVGRYYSGQLIDIGIGAGGFMRTWGLERSFGYDINPVAVEWLNSVGLYRDPYRWRTPAMTFWDSIEHIPDPAPLLRNVDRWVFMALPVFDSMGHVMTSKHYRPGEHCWYFTLRGLVSWMRAQGFAQRECNRAETHLGREDIQSFAFERL